MKKKIIKYVIGIDPGTKTGIAVWDSENQSFELIKTMTIIESIRLIESYKSGQHGDELFIRIEDPNQRKWYGANSNAKKQGAGSVKRDFKILKTEIEKMGIPFHAYNPKDVRTKVDSHTFKKITGWEERTSSHSRDAALAVYKF